MILHRYFGSHVIETLGDAKLKTSRISSFNDPFEFLYVSVGKVTREAVQKFVRSRDSNPLFLIVKSLFGKQFPNLQITEQEFELFLSNPAAIEDIVQKWPSIVKDTDLSLERRRHLIDRELRAICFSDPRQVRPLDEILLWSHYANKQKGIRIEFDFPDGLKEPFEIMEIRYGESRVKVAFSLGSNEEALKALHESAKVKSEAWEYEHEFRLFTKTDRCERREIKYGNGTTSEEHFLEFKREWVKSVDFGVLCPDSEIEQVLALVKKNYPNGVVCKKARFHETEYALDYEKI